MRMERGQAACQRLARPAQLLQAGRHLAVAQAAIVAARPADDLLLARVAAGRMARRRPVAGPPASQARTADVGAARPQTGPGRRNDGGACPGLRSRPLPLRATAEVPNGHIWTGSAQVATRAMSRQIGGPERFAAGRCTDPGQNRSI